MRKARYMLFIIFCLFIFPVVTHAKCDYQRLAELNKIASNVQTSYTYRLDNNNLIFNVELSNITNDIYVIDSDGVLFNSSSYVREYNYAQTVTYTIYSNDPNCYGERIVSKNVVLPFFNRYSLLDECKLRTDHKYCQPWTNTGGLSKEDVLRELSHYIEYSKGNDNSVKDNKYKYIKYIMITLFIVICAFLFLMRRRKI